MKDTLIVWRRTGKEHGENTGFRLNPPDVIENSLRVKVEDSRSVDPQTWSWWQVDDELLIEKNRPGVDWPRATEVLYYHLPAQHCLIVEKAFNRRMGADWSWYVHIGDHEWRADLEAWVFTDLFADILVHQDGKQHTVVDLDDLAEAVELEIVTLQKAAETLHHTQSLVDSIVAGEFPPNKIRPWRQHLQDQGLIEES